MRIDGIEETPNETYKDCEIEIQELIKNKLKIKEYIEIDRCYRLSKKKNQNRPRTIICLITSLKKKRETFEKYRYFHLRRFLQRHDGNEEKTLAGIVGVSKSK